MEQAPTNWSLPLLRSQSSQAFGLCLRQVAASPEGFLKPIGIDSIGVKEKNVIYPIGITGREGCSCRSAYPSPGTALRQDDDLPSCTTPFFFHSNTLCKTRAVLCIPGGSLLMKEQKSSAACPRFFHVDNVDNVDNSASNMSDTVACKHVNK